MKKYSVLSLILVFAMFAALFSACTENSSSAQQYDSNTDITDEADKAVVSETEPSRAAAPDDLPASLNYDGQTVRILYRDNPNIRDYQMIGENNGGDILYDAVYARNANVAERLNVNFEFISGEDPDGWGNSYRDMIGRTILSGDSIWDILFLSAQYGFTQMLNGYYTDLIDLPHINIEQPWWWKTYMEEESIDTSTRYMLNGDLTLYALMSATAAYFNRNMFENSFGSTDELYQTVRDGKWTFDKFMEYCKGVYSDVNGDGAKDDGDTYGARHTSIFTAVNYPTLSNGLRMSKRNPEGLPILDVYNENWLNWTDMLYEYVMGGEASKIADSGTSEDYFVKQGSLFHMGMLYDANKFRDTEFGYGIVPFPKMNENLNYMSAGATPNADAIFIPITTPKSLYDVCGASLEALCAESYRTITETYYETTLKGKYLENQSDIEMVDIIYKNIDTCFVMVAGVELGGGAISSMFVYVLRDNDGNLTSYYDKNKDKFEQLMISMNDKYKGLPE